ncbi:MAG: hypothetical protein NTZ94_02265 [Verrucomicrobia bacterium]|nr:hypothetical protein [Verrucomicrobiota bacterium]
MIFSQRIVSYFIDRCRDRGVVNWGPFAGAPATEDSLAHCWMRLLGVYEFYLHPAVEAALLAKPPVVVDVGASSGYYSIGMAYRLPGSRHFAFEMQENERESLARTAAKINTPINLRGLCTTADLVEIAQNEPRGFLVMDCEGAERELLGDQVHRHLKNWTILLEVHDWHAPGAGEEIYKRFETTHSIQTLWSRTAGPKEFRTIVPWPLNIYCSGVLRRICEEGRGGAGMRFFSMVPKA